MIIGEGETFDWSNVIAKPDLLECRDPTKETNLIFGNNSSFYEDDQEWPVILSYKYFSFLKLLCSSSKKIILFESVLYDSFKARI